MLAEQSLRDGDLNKAMSELEGAVRDDPASSRYRVFLFQLLCIRGDWDRALTQLDVLKDMDAETIPMVQTYREAIRCEALRDDVFGGRKSPLIFGEPAEWIALMIESLKHAAEGRESEAAELRERALDSAPAVGGTIAGADEQPVPFEWLADADSRLGPLLEVVMQGKYYWIPFDRLARLDLEAPTDLRDMVWVPAHFQWTNGGEEVGLVPTRYPGSQQHDDAAIQLARKTDWTGSDGAAYGWGQRTLATEADDYPILQVRSVRFDVEIEQPEAEGDSATED